MVPGFNVVVGGKVVIGVVAPLESPLPVYLHNEQYIDSNAT